MLEISSDKVGKNIGKHYNTFKVVTTPNTARTLTKWIFVLVGVVFVIMLLPWRQNIRGSGRLTPFRPQDRPQTIQTTIPGRIEKWYVQEGDLVLKGDTILVLTEIKEKFFDPELLNRLNQQMLAKKGSINAYINKAENLRGQIGMLRTGRELSLSKARNKLTQARLKLYSDSLDYQAAKVQLDVARQQFDRMQKMYEQGLASLTTFETRKVKFQESQAKEFSALNKYLAAQNEVLNATIELNSIDAEYADKIFKSESELNSALSYAFDSEGELAKLEVEFSNTAIRSSYYVIRAPQSGYVVNALKTGLGENIKEGEAVATIIPESPQLAVELFVKPIDLPLLQPGREVRLQFDGWPVIVFSGWPGATVGTFGGRIEVIDYINSDKGNYRVLITQLPGDTPWPSQLRVGTGVYGWAMLETVPVWYEIWRLMNGFPPDFTQSLPKSKAEINSKEGKSKNDDLFYETEKSDSKGIKRKAK